MRERTVLIIDDHEGFRTAATTMLEAHGCLVVGALERGEEAVEAVAALHPDLVLLDIQLPGIDGVVVAEQLAKLTRRPAVILISSREDAGCEPRVLGAPVRGFLSKRDLGEASIAGLLT